MTAGSSSTHEDALQWISLEQELRQEQPQEWAARFKGASQNGCNRLFIILARHATNSQIHQLLQILDNNATGQAESINHWRKTLLRFAPNFFSNCNDYHIQNSYQKEHWLTHYSSIEHKQQRRRKQPRSTIIALTGSSGLLMAPIACVIAALANHDYDLIVIRRRFKTGYFEKNGELLRLISEHLKAKRGENLCQSIMLGTSNGGLAALYMAHALELPLGIAIGAGATAETFTAQGSLNSAAHHLSRPTGRIPLPWQTTRLLLAASGDNQQDKQSAILISDHFNSCHRRTARATAMFFPGYSRHGLPKDLSHKGIPLEHLLIPLLKSKLNRLPKHRRYS